MAGNVEQGTAPEAAAAQQSAEPAYRAEIIANPRELDPERADSLNRQYADLACLACGGDAEDEESEEAIRQGWQAYCMSPGGRTQDFDRLVLVWHGDEMVGFSGYVVEKIVAYVTVLWDKAAGTHPARQGPSAMGGAPDPIPEHTWFAGFR